MYVSKRARSFRSKPNMINIKENVSLKPYNTFGLEVSARCFTEITVADQLTALLQDPAWSTAKKLFLGGGSNILLLNDFEGLVIRIAIKGIKVTEETPDHVI